MLTVEDLQSPLRNFSLKNNQLSKQHIYVFSIYISLFEGV